MDAANSRDRLELYVGAAVFFLILVVYLITISPTVSFWDSGEFIATSHILGIPHPPGTPFYVILGRMFAMIPGLQSALAVNLMSALTGALACLFLYLITVKILVLWRGTPQSMSEKITVYASAASATVAGAFAGSYWVNSIEAEVYSPAAFIMAFTVWLMLRWGERYKEPGSRNYLLLICYLLALSVGLHLGTVLVLPAFIAFALLTDWRVFTDAKFLILVAFVALLGLSNHLFLPIRSHLNPAIDEANPERWIAFKNCLLRKQYKPMNPFLRQAPWSFQFGMFWQYFREQWSAGGMSWTALLILVGAVGSVVHFFKEKKTFILVGILFLITSLGLIVYMNFTDHEVRERDYFFAHGFFFFCIWIGVAYAYFIDKLREWLESDRLTYLGIAALVAFTLSTIYINFRTHDRAGNYNAYDYAYNLLSTVDEDGMIFTNGDNDTFPLWFMQEVKEYRKDVRVLNLSLLNTPWYIWQLKHLEPKVPMRYSDQTIGELQPYRDSETGRIVLVKDIASREIIEANNWRKPVYFAVTVADYMGYDRHLMLEGLAFRMVPEEGTRLIDVDRTLYNLYSLYSYRGLLKPANPDAVVPPPDLANTAIRGDISGEDTVTSYRYDYVYDNDVYKDENTQRLITNYAAAHLRLCIFYLENNQYDRALKELEMAGMISPGYQGYRDLAVVTYGFAGDVATAESLANDYILRNPNSENVYIQLFRVYRKQGLTGKAEQILARLINAFPDYADGYSLLTSLYQEEGDQDAAIGVVSRWLSLHPNDRAAARLLQRMEQEREEGTQ
jgi:tetratricopeptide (TPR) repeat protein